MSGRSGSDPGPSLSSGSKSSSKCCGKGKLYCNKWKVRVSAVVGPQWRESIVKKKGWWGTWVVRPLRFLQGRESANALALARAFASLRCGTQRATCL